MESRKTVLMSLFAGQHWRCRCDEWTCGHRLGGGGDELGEAHGHVYTTVFAVAYKREPAAAALQHRELSLKLCNDRDGEDGGSGSEVPEWGDTCMRIADSRCCTTETNAIL